MTELSQQDSCRVGPTAQQQQICRMKKGAGDWWPRQWQSLWRKGWRSVWAALCCLLLPLRLFLIWAEQVCSTLVKQWLQPVARVPPGEDIGFNWKSSPKMLHPKPFSTWSYHTSWSPSVVFLGCLSCGLTLLPDNSISFFFTLEDMLREEGKGPPSCLILTLDMPSPHQAQTLKANPFRWAFLQKEHLLSANKCRAH